MRPTESILEGFFQGEKQFFIPVYQRAYSWEEPQWKIFLEDLEEATKGENHYFFGNVLLEIIERDKSFDIIDGQQRLTTIIIFVRCLVNVLDSKGYDKEQLEYIKQDYLENRKKPKLNALEYDRDYFYDVIIANSDNKHKPQTPSQKRISEAKKFFKKELNSKEITQLEEILKAMQKAQIIKLEFDNKKDSVLMFELQNNRGKDLTNMEKLKSYLAYQIYTYDKDSAETKLDEMTSVFKEIYRVVNDIKQLNEDAILGYFNIATSKFGFAYREDNNSLNYKKELKDIKDSEEKLAWIDKYVKSLKDAFFDFKTFMKSKSDYKEYLLHLNVAATYPFVIKAYRLFRDDEEKLEGVFKALEVIAFRDKLVSTRAKIRDKLNSALKNFDSVENLESGIKYVCDNEGHWTDDRVRESLEPKVYSLGNIAPYIFMRYENALRNEMTRTKGYVFTLQEIEKPQIEHIAPQTENDEKVASGYCEYDEDFYDNCYLHCIGNLMLIAQPHNISIGNKPFADKLQSYQNSPMLQHREIKEFASGEVWDKDSIDNRHETLVEFILKTWSL